MIWRNIRKVGAGTLRRLLNYHDAMISNRAHNYVARKAYNAIVAQDPSRRLSEQMQKTIQDYARSVLGSPVYAPWLETYTAYRGAFQAGWIPDNYFGNIVVNHICPPNYRYLSDKTVAARFFQSDLFPDLVYCINGGLYDRNFDPVEAGGIAAIVFAENDTAILKVVRSSQGRGVLRIERNGFDPAAALRLGNFVIQSPVEQHPFFRQFSPGGGATIRLTTVKANGGRAELRAGYLRGGRMAESCVMSASAMRIPLDAATGELQAEAANPDWTRTDRHPDTGAAFAGASIPAFSKAVDACLALHDRAPHVLCAGWDLCITPGAEVRIFEVNSGHTGVNFSEAATGPIFLGLGFDTLHRTGFGA
jgi:Sugar-transfer associated ATP-grasp